MYLMDWGTLEWMWMWVRPLGVPSIRTLRVRLSTSAVQAVSVLTSGRGSARARNAAI